MRVFWKFLVVVHRFSNISNIYAYIRQIWAKSVERQVPTYLYIIKLSLSVFICQV